MLLDVARRENNVFLLPFSTLLLSAIVVGCLIASLVLDTNEGPDVNNLYWVNTMRDSFTCNVRFSGFFCRWQLLFISVQEYAYPFGLTHVVSSTFDRIYSGNHFCPRAIYCLRHSYGHVCRFNRFKVDERVKQVKCLDWQKFQGATSHYAPWNDVCSTTCIQRGTSASPFLHLSSGQVTKNVLTLLDVEGCQYWIIQ